jgi:hypothetical protein
MIEVPVAGGGHACAAASPFSQRLGGVAKRWIDLRGLSEHSAHVSVQKLEVNQVDKNLVVALSIGPP